MEIFGVGIAAVVLLGPWVLAIVALVRANRASEAARSAAATAGSAARYAARLAARADRAPSEPEPEPGRPTDAFRARAQPPGAAPPVGASPPPPAGPSPATSPSPPEPPQPLPAVPPARPPPAAARPAPARLEERIALVWFTRVGALAVLVGAAYFLKYAIDNAWLGPWGRLAGASLSGAAALAAGEVLRPRTRPVWIHALQGAGIALLFLAAFGSHALYHLVPVAAAFGAVAAVALLGGALALRHRAEALLVLALLGGLLAPVLLSTGEDRPVALFGYLLVLGGLALLVSIRLGFRIAPWIALAGTVALGAGWWERFFDVRPPPPWSDPSLPLSEQMGRYHPLLRRAVPIAAALAFAASWLLAWERLRSGARRAWSDAWLAAALLFTVAAPFLLVHDRPLLGAVALAGSAVLAAALLHRAGRLPFVLGAEVAAFALLWGATAGRPPGPAAAWIGAAAIVAATYLAVPAHSWLVRGDPPRPALAAIAAIAGLAFTALAIALTGEREGVLRAALVGGAGATELALGAAVVRRARAHGTVLLGAALALLAGAAAFLFSGATVTVVWAAMACAAAVLGARERDPWWLGGAGALFVAALARVLAIDLRAVGLASRRFLETAGVEGRLEPLLLANPRAIALAAVAVALLVAADRVRRAGGRWRIPAGIAAGAAWALVVTLAVTEARDLALALPDPPPAGDAAAFVPFRWEVSDAMASQRGSLSAIASLVLAGCAALLVAGGFVFRDAFHRWLGIGLFGVVLGKLLVVDVWRLSRLQQVAVFLGVGALLLAAAFLYARYGRRIAALLQDPPRPTGGGTIAVLLAAGVLSSAGHAQAMDRSRFRTAATVTGVAAPGLHVIEADEALLRGSRAPAGTLSDVRIEGPDGAEVPWLLRTGGPEAPERAVEGMVLDPVVLGDGSVRALVDLGRAPPRHGELRLRLEGEEFLRSVRVEVSDDGRRFGVLEEGARVWAIRDAPEAGRSTVRHPQSQARWVRVTLLPGAGDPPRILGASVAAGDAPGPRERFLDLPAPPPVRSPDGRETLLDLDLGTAGLPVEVVALDVATPAFERQVRVWASADGAHWVRAGVGAIWRARRGSGPGAEGVRVAAATGGRRWLRVAIADGDSPPLLIAMVHAGWAVREVLFQASAAGPHVLLAGADVPAPAYDLGALLAREGGVPEAAPAHLGPARSNPAFRERAADEPFTERHRTALSVVLALLFASLAVWAVRLLRRPA